VVDGLIERRHPGAEKTGRQVTVSSDLIYDVCASTSRSRAAARAEGRPPGDWRERGNRARIAGSQLQRARWSGLAAGLSMGFSLVVEGLLRHHLPDAPWRPLIESFGCTTGLIIVILGRQQLFTESTLKGVIRC
jgi:formate/nitrite transporter FocA (FNT family)